MSDDRFKQARRSLYEQHEQRQQGFDDFEDEATAMVDIMSAQQPGAAEPPPPSGQSLQIGAPSFDEFDAGAATEFVNMSDVQAHGPAGAPSPPLEAGSTEFVNLQDLSAGPGPSAHMMQNPVTAPPMHHPAMPSQQPMGGFTGASPMQDPVLTQHYRFGPEGIQEGAFTLIFAQNMAGHHVILKRLYSSDPNTMPPELNQRVQTVASIQHPKLVPMTQMLPTHSGVWAELPRPPGYRLSDVLSQNGPQPKEVVGRWTAEVAEVLTAIHQAGFVYANLTPDAVWVQDDGGIFLEPFDVLAFEDRGDLAPFGPREMAFPPDQRVLTPTSDTFCLATTMFAALTGLPLDMSKAADVEPKLGTAFQQALTPNPNERSTPQEFAKPFKPRTRKGQLPDLDAKFLIIGLGALVFITLGIFYYQKVQGDKAAAAAALAAQKPVAAPIPEGAKDPRITIKRGLEQDPVRKFEPTMENASTRDREIAAKQRKKARKALQTAEKTSGKSQADAYAQVLKALTTAVRLTGFTSEDEDLIIDLYEQKAVITLRRNYYANITKAFAEDDLGSARTIYSSLAAIDPEAEGVMFFNGNKTATVKRLLPIGGARPVQNETEEP